MSLRLVTPATGLAVTLEQVKEHLRANDGTDEDSLLTAYISAATELAEQKTGRSLMLQTWEMTLDAFPAAFKLIGIPVASIASVKYYDANGAQQTLDSTHYALDNADDYGSAYLVPAYGETWPDTNAQINAVAVRYVAGYPNADSVPESIRAWIKLMVGAMYMSRESEIIGNGSAITLGFADRLLDRYKVWV